MSWPKKPPLAVCRFLLDEDGKEKLIAPGVNCSLNCDTCGWNPEEQERRLTQGRMETNDGITKLVFPRKVTT